MSKLSSSDADTSLDGVKINAPLVTTPDTPEVPDFKLRPRAPISLQTPERERQEIAPIEHRKVGSLVFSVKVLTSVVDFVGLRKNHQYARIVANGQ